MKFEGLLFRSASFLSRPPGFYVVLAGMAACTILAVFGHVNVTTFFLSVLAIVMTGVVLVQNYRDTAAMQAKLDEIITALEAARNELVGLEHERRDTIREALKEIEQRAADAIRTNTVAP
jgi:low affinity Fe/Cu permease